MDSNLDADNEEPGPSGQRPTMPRTRRQPKPQAKAQIAGRNMAMRHDNFNQEGWNHAAQRWRHSAHPSTDGRQQYRPRANTNNNPWNEFLPADRNVNRQYFPRDEHRFGGNPSRNLINNRYNNVDNELNRQMRNFSQLNLHQDGSRIRQPIQNKRKYIGFKFLQELSQADSKQIISGINEKKQAFFEFLESSIEKEDLYVLVMKIISKACTSTFEQLKSNLLLDICNSKFITNLRNFLMDLPYKKKDTIHSMYWKNQVAFWEDFITFSDYIIKTFPSIAINKCSSLIDATTKSCLQGLKERHGFDLSEEQVKNLERLRNGLKIKEQETDKVQSKKLIQHNESEPPESFRQLSVLPGRDDLIEKRPYLRPNIVNGGYVDIEHYLDVQFRLLREDCFGRLRDGIQQFMEDPKRKKFDNIRIYHNVLFIHPYVSKQKFGSVVQVDNNTMKRFKKINWHHSKRLIFGSLLLFTKDNCRTFIVATILERDVKLLALGKIPIAVMSNNIDYDIYKGNEPYVMIESDVYFEPYFHVLKALQDPTFPQHIAMSKYIVNVDPEPQHPCYLNENSVFTMKVNHNTKLKVTVLNEDTWPSSEELGLNESQYEAYRLALTHEFAVIQGPPGTGKTYLGVKVAKTLLKNFSDSNRGCLLLLICYTNHALDQFLEAILSITRSIVRIGGQSRSETLEGFNLNKIRSTVIYNENNITNLFFEHRSNLKAVVDELRRLQLQIDTLTEGILSYNSVKNFVDESYILGSNVNYKNAKDPIIHWLFENMPYRFDESLLIEQPVDLLQNVNDDINANNHVDFDIFFGDEEEFYTGELSGSFSHVHEETKLKRLLANYNKSQDNVEKKYLMREIVTFSSRIALFQEMVELRYVEPLILEREDPSSYSTEERWRIYFGWANKIFQKLTKQMKVLEKKLSAANTAYEETRILMDLEILKNVKVVGMTTSGAARLRKLLQELAPPIVIVEEAAEVFEQHIVTSLTKDCKHLILIGDHQQLRPSAAHMKLARLYNIEVSLFERMIVNKIHSRRLCVQHRMRPEIAALISPHIYPDLLNHHSVENLPRILGMCNDVFFYTHMFREEKMEDSASKENHKEGDMVLRLANYLIQQGYDSSDVTILAAYSGQMFYLRNQRPTYSHLSKVKITVVDNYQGEECKIILLSLVRNNSEKNIGFLKTENRVCVALSRAKEGFYIFGNIDILKEQSELWVKIAETLEKNGSLGTSLRLRCEVHKDIITTVTEPNDFEKVPEGGCLLKCNFNLRSCNHQCPLICHAYDRDHKNIKCTMKCERTICELKHACPLICSKPCAPCKQPVRKELPCGHWKDMKCWMDPTEETVKCQVPVPVTLPDCGHQTHKQCHENVKFVECPIKCDARLNCGHVCVLNCHVTRDPEHVKYICKKPCAKAKNGCTIELEGDLGPHQCRKMCHETCDDCIVKVKKKRSNCKHTEFVACNESVDNKPCRKNCARVMSCGHFCKKKCNEPCGDCHNRVKKKIPECGHEVTMMCSKEATRDMCVKSCERTLACGHACKARCAQQCDPALCVEPVPKEFPSPCGHVVTLPCNVSASVVDGVVEEAVLLQHCSAPCRVELACGHLCGGSCSRCLQGRLHVSCTQMCNQIIICGHQCEEPCNQICPPCRKPCEVKCKHSRCKNLCGEPCMPCKEACSRSCMHGACTRLCGEPCDRPPCTEPCASDLPCGHRCRGLCGEPCPQVCELCNPDDFPTDFLGDRFDQDDKFILLEDCNHVLEVENMNNLMFGDKDTVSIRVCPYCRKPIINTHRYKDFVNDMFKKEINPIKERVYGTAAQINQKKIELKEKLKLLTDHATDLHISSWKKALRDIIYKFQNAKKVSLLQLEMHFICLNILEAISEIYKKYVSSKLVELHKEVINQVDLICNILSNPHYMQKVSQQQQKDIGNEIKRMNSIIQFAEIVSSPTYMITKQTPKVQEAMKKCKAVVTGWTMYNENEGIEALKMLQESVNLSGIVTKHERDLIVRAIGLKAGRWYKCPNGHFYCIGECGGAMQVSKCIECGASIGGTSHTLLNSNRHAPEMDGSKFPAWSEQYNAMANFDLEENF